MDRADRCRLRGRHLTVALVSIRCQNTVGQLRWLLGLARTDVTASWTSVLNLFSNLNWTVHLVFNIDLQDYKTLGSYSP